MLEVTWTRRRDGEDRDPLLAAARTGDEDALARLLLPHEARLRALCRQLLPIDDAEDALQETLLRALRNLPRLRDESLLRAWLVRIALHVCLDRRRAERNRRPLFPLPAPAPAPEAETVRRALLDQALAQLSPRRRTLVLLVADGWSLREIGQGMGWPEPRVKVELYRARKTIEAWARKNGWEES